MEKSEFKKKQEEINSKIRELQNQLCDLKKEYISSNKIFDNGTKVKIIYPTHKNNWNENTVPERYDYGFVYGHTLDYKYDVVPQLHKCKKDGTESSVSYGSFYGGIITEVK
jgi:hypothetical protein